MSDERSTPELPPGALIDGRYKIVQRLGTGCLGTVFLVEDLLREGFRCALKMVTWAKDETEALDNLKAEFRIMTKLTHPHLARIYDFSPLRDRSAAYFTLDYISGPDLLHWSQDSDLEQIYLVLEQICDALAYLHSQGIVHGDVKPQNILVATDPDRASTGPMAKVLDFGLAAEVASQESDRIAGTVCYMAPEMLQGGLVQPSIDLYAFGVVLYELATGRLPFDGESVASIVRQHLYAPVAPPSTLEEDIPEDLSALILRLLAKAPTARYESAEAVRSALGRLAGRVAAATDVHRARFVGRGEEVATIDGLLAELKERKATARLVALSGETGIGKTRLAQEAVYSGQLKDLRCLMGRWVEGDRASLAAFEQPVRTIVLTGDLVNAPGERTARYAAAIRRVAPGAFGEDERPEPVALDVRDDELRIAHSLAALLLDYAARHPCLLVLEDAQWAPRQSIEALRYVVRSVKHEPLMVCLTHRDDEPLPHHLERFLEEMTESLVPLELGCLAADEASELIASVLAVERVPDWLVDKLMEWTGGRPLFLVQVVRWLAQEGKVTVAAGHLHTEAAELASVVVPPTIAELLSSRLDKLPPDDRHVLGVLSAFRTPATFPALVQLLGRPSKSLAATLARLAARHFLDAVETRHGYGYSLTSGELRVGLYDELDSARRGSLHGAIAEALNASPEADDLIEEVAFHFLEAGRRDQGIRYGVRAAERLRGSYAFERAASLLERVVDLTSGARARVSVLERLGDLYDRIGAPEKAVPCLDEVSVCDDAPLEVRARAHRKLGHILLSRGEYARAAERLDRGLEMLAGTEAPVEKALLLQAQGQLEAKEGHCERALEWFRAGLEALEESKHPLEAASIYGNLGGLHQLTGDYASAMAEHEQCLAVSEREDDQLGVSKCLHNLGNIAFLTNDYTAAEDYYQRSLARKREIGAVLEVSSSLNALGRLCQATGDLARAVDYFEQSLEIRGKVGDSPGVGLLCCCLGGVWHGLGYYSKAIAYLQQSLALEESASEAAVLAPLSALAGVYAEIGQFEEADELLQRALTVAKQLGNTPGEGTVRYLLGKVRLGQGALHEARDLLEQAISTFTQSQDKWQASFALLDVARLVLRQGETRVAAGRIREARRLADEVGARAAVLQADILHAKVRLGSETPDAGAITSALGRVAREAKGLRRPELEWEACYVMGKAYESEGMQRRALQCYDKVLRVFEAERARLESHELLTTYLGTGERAEALETILALQASG